MNEIHWYFPHANKACKIMDCTKLQLFRCKKHGLTLEQIFLKAGYLKWHDFNVLIKDVRAMRTLNGPRLIGKKTLLRHTALG